MIRSIRDILEFTISADSFYTPSGVNFYIEVNSILFEKVLVSPLFINLNFNKVKLITAGGKEVFIILKKDED